MKQLMFGHDPTKTLCLVLTAWGDKHVLEFLQDAKW